MRVRKSPEPMSHLMFPMRPMQLQPQPQEVSTRRKGSGSENPVNRSKKGMFGTSMDYEYMDVSDDGEEASVEIIGEDSNDPMDFDDASDDDVVYLGEEGGEGGRGFGSLNLETSDANDEVASDSSDESEATQEVASDVSNSSHDSETVLFSEEESAHSDDKDYDPEESESSEFSEESSSSGGDGQWSDESDADMKKGENANKREKQKGSGKAKKGEGVQDNIEVNKVHYIDEGEVKRGFRKEGKGKTVEGGVEVKKGQHSSRKDVTALLLKFCFGSKKPSVPEKPELDPEENELWDEFRFSLRSCDIGSTGSNKVGNQDSVPTIHEEDTATLCKRGSHQLILDEEIGLRCKFCTYLAKEIKYIFPEFVENPYKKFGRRGFETDNWSIFDELRSHDSGSGPHSGCRSHLHDEGTVWDFIPGVKSSMYPHQREGFEFLWNHIAGGIHVEELKKRSSNYAGNGCIITHAPGTGKTRLAIVFLQTYMQQFPHCRPLLIAPRSMLLTWEEEFQKWGFDIPFHNLNNTDLSGEEIETDVNLVMQIEGRKSINRVKNSRMLKLCSWTKKRSILGISYQLFEKLCGTNHSGALKQAEEWRKIILEFPGLVVFDEGHTPRSDQSRIWKALSDFKTKRRILLSGTPFQNNFQELFNTICLVRPTFADSIDSNKFTGDFRRNQSQKRNLETWQWTSVTNCSGNVNDKRERHATEVKAKIAPFVNVYKGSVLQDSLPGLRNSVVVLHPTQLQEEFHKRIQVIKSQFENEHLESLISIHPSLLLNKEAFSGDWDKLNKLKLNPDVGVKVKFVMDLIRLSDALNERVLVFSQYIKPLVLTRDLLRSQFHWIEREDVLYMDGSCDMKQRQSSMKVFNDPSIKAKVLLASTKGCCEGISLVGASRVVLLDVTWNLSVERPAISRAYRLGQKKVVHLYHLLMGGTNEEHKYQRQVDKSRTFAQHEKLKHIFESIALLHEDIYFEQLGLSTFAA
ncbi:SNF2 domain-containing protein CLASSY 3-like [Pyrus ussuriensis x Pyrus communis]|uniref:SNF2 domain-containing protein CLASSY 3-like n=1 Tax=Pyrus ussuriensis x Pyrus communis TaxID=2448454 RepID=A0A5N5G6I5_9ROSA|nr:SNF2 domain-containing protein CLASSY 3-like [Pyrus ussuriensis x Pyrus communis]